MHFVLSWDIAATGKERETLEEALKACIKSYSWVRPLTTVYVIKINTNSEWPKILDALSKVAQSYEPKIRFIMSPPSTGGKYNGWLSNNLWNEINKRTE